MDEYLIVSGEQDFSEFVVEIGLCPAGTRVRASVHPDDLQWEARHLPHTAAAPCRCGISRHHRQSGSPSLDAEAHDEAGTLARVCQPHRDVSRGRDHVSRPQRSSVMEGHLYDFGTIR